MAMPEPPVKARKAKPFLKWAGGKSSLLAQYEPLFPQSFNRYFEPFVGSGAVFFHLQPAQAMLSDVNPDLITVYSTIQSDVDALIELLQAYRARHDKAFYHHIRAQEAETLSALERAARFIYLNKTCFNGLYRVNRHGQFNVPMGRYANPAICDAETLRLAHKALQGVDILLAPYTHVTNLSKKDDFVYFDPPYQPLSATSSFTSYTKDAFGTEAQSALADCFRLLSQRGCRVMLSNSDTPFIRELYADFHIHTVQAARFINSKAAGRGKIPEVVVCNYASGPG